MTTDRTTAADDVFAAHLARWEAAEEVSPWDDDVPDPRFREQLADRIYTAWTGQQYWGGCDQRESVDRVLDVIAAHVEAEVQAATNQRAVEVLRAAALEQLDEANAVPDTDEGTHADGHRCAADFLIRRANLVAALTQPARDKP